MSMFDNPEPRDPARFDDLADAMAALRDSGTDLRLGQIIRNVLLSNGSDDLLRDLFNVEDDVLADLLRQEAAEESRRLDQKTTEN